ncbi:MAG TPA: hypothetical protein VE133_17510, partial [Candidatus Sulfotelmatobacter sp.]|nr:hypothetical protein [Candidatus Sulfotelmatobacter sp.]
MNAQDELIDQTEVEMTGLIRRGLLAGIFLLSTLPAIGQAAVLVYNNDSTLMQCDRTRIFVPSRPDHTRVEALFIIKGIAVTARSRNNFFDADDNDGNEEHSVVNIGCIRYSSDRVQWFYQAEDGTFTLADRQPSQTDHNAKFDLVTAEPDEDSDPLPTVKHAYLHSPDGKPLGTFDFNYFFDQAQKVIALNRQLDANDAASRATPASPAPPASNIPPSNPGPVKTRWGVSITFKSCGYRAF